MTRYVTAKEKALSHKPARAKYAVLAQVCPLIAPYLVSKLAREQEVEKKARTFSSWSHVAAVRNPMKRWPSSREAL